MKSEKSILLYLFLGAISAFTAFVVMHLIATLLFSPVFDIFSKYLAFWHYASYCFAFLFVGLMLTFSIYEALTSKFCKPSVKKNVFCDFESYKMHPTVTNISYMQKSLINFKDAKSSRFDNRRLIYKRTQHK